MQAGLVLLVLLIGVGLGSLLASSPTAFNVVRVIGGGYLVYVGITAWRAHSSLAPADKRAGGTATWSKCWLTGFLTNATNPKGLLFFMAALPQFLGAPESLPTQLAIMCLTMVVIDAAVMSGYAQCASGLRNFLHHPSSARVLHRLFGGFFVAVGISLTFPIVLQAADIGQPAGTVSAVLDFNLQMLGVS
jgi:homoserine/homoserine lactone efflux protein